MKYIILLFIVFWIILIIRFELNPKFDYLINGDLILWYGVKNRRYIILHRADEKD